MPDSRYVRTTPIWKVGTVPAALRRAHRIAEGTWGRIVVHDGRLRFVGATTPANHRELGKGETQAIHPGVEHAIEPLGVVRLSVEFFVVDRRGQPHERTETRTVEVEESADEGGDPARWAGFACLECGAITSGGLHRADCPALGETK